MARISKKKNVYTLIDPLREYLRTYDREYRLPLLYEDLLEYDDSVALIDKDMEDTLWETVIFPQLEVNNIHQGLKKIYALLRAGGDLSVMDHLFIERIDICLYGNTRPFRVRIVNKINDNFDYFYIKKADASRIYGLELEHLLSPNRISFLVHQETLIEEHIIGVPGDMFIKQYLNDRINKVRLAKEFVKFNERCFVRLLGDMHASNFVVDITPDFEEVSYRLRAIDFDQQSYEGRKVVYMPQYFKENNPIINLGIGTLTPETVLQYQKEERSLISRRYKANANVDDLLRVMVTDIIAPEKNVRNLGQELADHHKDGRFLGCKTMGQLVKLSLDRLMG
ncbi:MAG: hypothetical protein OEX02_15580 [Cyclobacteriaceae bacterium]|nr:hypothetical protein [Cyclobacteriaceae bacterium]